MVVVHSGNADYQIRHDQRDDGLHLDWLAVLDRGEVWIYKDAGKNYKPFKGDKKPLNKTDEYDDIEMPYIPEPKIISGRMGQNCIASRFVGYYERAV